MKIRKKEGKKQRERARMSDRITYLERMEHKELKKEAERLIVNLDLVLRILTKIYILPRHRLGLIVKVSLAVYFLLFRFSFVSLT